MRGRESILFLGLSYPLGVVMSYLYWNTLRFNSIHVIGLCLYSLYFHFYMMFSKAIDKAKNSHILTQKREEAKNSHICNKVTIKWWV